jgi:hypothetical protein
VARGTRGSLLPTGHAEGGASSLAGHLVGATPVVVRPSLDQAAVHDLNGVDGSAVTTSVVIASRTRLPARGPRSTPLGVMDWMALALRMLGRLIKPRFT